MIGAENSAKGVKRLHRKAQAEEKTMEDPEPLENSEPENSEEDSEASDVESEGDAGSSDDGGSEGSESEDKKPSSHANPGWADVMQKILNTKKPKKKKTIVLSKAKKLSEIKPKEILENAPFEIQNKDGERRKETLPKKEKDESEETQPKKRRKEQLGIRVKPSVLDKGREKSLQKIATKGVVQLFNVVKQQQTEIDKKLIEAGPLERKREKVMQSIDKQGFLDVLMGGSKNVPVEETKKSAIIMKNEGEKADKVWSVLRDDFVMGAKLKDWDKKAPNDDDDDSTSTEEMDSD